MSKRLSNNPKKYQTIVIVGKKGAGKSTLVKKMVKKIGVSKDRRFLISYTADLDDTLRSSFDKENVFNSFDNAIIQHIKDVINEETKKLTFKFHHKYDKETDEYKIIKARIGKKPKLPPYLIVCDDCMGSSILKRNGGMEVLFTKSRHLRLNIIVVGHSYKYIPVMMRVNSDRLIFFSQNNAELKKIEEEHSKEREKKTFETKFRDATDKRFGTFEINYNNNPIY
tara:strand:+ start:871 stop:1545 length:675 start_codon:yes stop_codon:yes gene_type:complete